MNAVEALDQHRAFIGEIGEDILVRRYAGTGAARAAVDAQVKARVSGFTPSELIGAIAQGDVNVIALNDPSAPVPAGKVALSDLLPLSVDDKLVIRGAEKSIKSIDDNTRRVAGVLIALNIHAKG